MVMRRGAIIIFTTQIISIIPIWLAWGWLAALIAIMALAASRGRIKRKGEGGIDLIEIASRYGVDLEIPRSVILLVVPIAGVIAAFRVWDPISGSLLLGMFILGLGVFFVGLITQ